MSDIRMRNGALVLLALAIAGAALWAAGCKKGGPKIETTKAQAYLCENCGHVFGVPFDVPPKDRVFPPMVCPKCGQRTAVEATYFEPKGGGEPVLYRLTRYTDAQIRQFEDFLRSAPEEIAEELSVEEALAESYDQTELKYPGEGDRWIKAPQAKAGYQEFQEIKDRFESPFEVFDPSWPVVEPSELKQWK